MGIETTLRATQKQAQIIAPHQLQGLKMLAQSIPEMRAEIIAQIEANPVLEDIDHPLEVPIVEIEREHKEEEPDYPRDDFTPGKNTDEETLERRQKFFDSIPAAGETLQEHLMAQLDMNEIATEDRDVAELIIADLDEDGRYTGAIADLSMVSGRSEDEVEGVRLEVMKLEPKGCGAKNPKECLLAQMDSLSDSPYRGIVRKLIEDYFEAIGVGRFGEVVKKLGITYGEYEAALKALRTLDPWPGRQFASARDKTEYIHPEVHAVRSADGWWKAQTDERSLPKVIISKKYLDMLEDKSLDSETRAFVNEKIAAAKELQDSIVKRQGTLQAIADFIFERQQDFFDDGPGAMKPLTEKEIAETVGVNPTTVSRAVRNKYADTPYGTIELRRFCTSGIKTASGEDSSQVAVLAALKGIIAKEDATAPLSDEKISKMLKEQGYKVERRTVAKYRGKLGIKGTSERKLRG